MAMTAAAGAQARPEIEDGFLMLDVMLLVGGSRQAEDPLD
jgi:hypothetical protein